MAPGKIVCIGWNYRSHVKELESELPKVPTVFLKPSTCLIGDGDEIVIPAGVTNVQHEVELAVVFGRRCKDATEDDALDYVSHVAVFNDVSARDMQTEARRTGNTWDLSKGMDTFGPMSEPVPLDAVADIQDLELTLTVNGEVRQHGNTREVHDDGARGYPDNGYPRGGVGDPSWGHGPCRDSRCGNRHQQGRRILTVNVRVVEASFSPRTSCSWRRGSPRS